MNKSEVLKDPNSCLNRAADDEPIFVLRGKDAIAAATIRHWATMALGTHEPDKIAAARSDAGEFEDWRYKNVTGHQTASDAIKED